MSAHGKVGIELERYRARRAKARRVVTFDRKTNTFRRMDVAGRYGKPSYLRRAEKRAKAVGA